ncbi:MAG: hypothetical protein J0L64_07330 [Acidobacteria bacterium]|nr:hypothetical protein [Acidobacteriota bacterium]
MRIESSAVDYAVQHTYSEMHRVQEEVRVQVQRGRRQSEPVRDRAELSSSCGACGNEVQEGGQDGDARTFLAKLVIRRLLGGRFAESGRYAEGGRYEEAGRGVRTRRGQGEEAPQAREPRWRVEVRRREVYQEQESLVVAAKGAVKTADGREFNFDAVFSLERRFRVEAGFALEASNEAKAKDPIFLDRDGVSQLLVRDANGDGKLSDLGEVFGAGTGDGFGELAALDADGNGWIDEGDPVFGELRLRLQDGTLAELGALGIGALSTSGAAGEFQYKNDANELVATVRKTGVYLNEDGTAGALRQIDLVM